MVINKKKDNPYCFNDLPVSPACAREVRLINNPFSYRFKTAIWHCGFGSNLADLTTIRQQRLALNLKIIMKIFVCFKNYY